MGVEKRNIIGYDYSEGTKEVLQGVNPISNTIIENEFYIASSNDVENVMQKAKTAFDIFRDLDWGLRSKFLEVIAEEMEALGSELVTCACDETGLPEARIIGERGRTVGQLRMFAQYIKTGSWVEATIDTALNEREPVPKPDLRKMMVPLGPVVVFGSSNFPLAYSVAGGDTASALAAGCPVIVKAHPAHPGTSALVGNAILRAAKKCNMPDGVFSLLFDNGFKVGKSLVEHPIVAAVGFTGSINGGRALFDIASNRKNPIPVFAEMGSTNPVVLLPEAINTRGEKIATDYASSITLGVGQFCTNPGLLFGIEGKSLNRFKKSLVSAFSQSIPGTMLHKGIEEAYGKKSNSIVAEDNVDVLVTSEINASEGQGRPTLAIASGAEFLNNATLHEEVFGPFSLLVECEDALQLNQCLKSLDGQLTGTIIGEVIDFKNHTTTISILKNKVGRLIFNGVPTGVEVCPSMHHGGPYPATTDSRFTAVGIHSIKRFLRPLSFQNTPDYLLPIPLQNNNSMGINRLVDGIYSQDSL
jgi:2,5-dioxopentanoate dehydrogenase